MGSMRKLMLVGLLLSVVAAVVIVPIAEAQEPAAEPAAPAAPAAAPAADGGTLVKDGREFRPEESGKGSGSFLAIVFRDALSFILWLAIFVTAGFGVYFAVDCFITVTAKKIMPDNLTHNVTEAMGEGDVLKALQHCENEPSPLANVLMAGFSHVEEGFDVIQEAVTTAADLETERIVQKLTWLSVVGNLSPMLGLLGTVQGMIAAFSHIGEGAPDIGVLALDISQALYTTAAGLTIAVPCVAFFFAFRNRANTIALKMEAMTMELIKDLRNVEVVEE